MFFFRILPCPDFSPEPIFNANQKLLPVISLKSHFSMKNIEAASYNNFHSGFLKIYIKSL